MVLSTTAHTSTMRGAKAAQTLEGDSGYSTKRISLLVDYSKRAADISDDLSSSSNAFTRHRTSLSAGRERLPRKDIGNHIHQALTNLSVTAFDSSFSTSPEQDVLGDSKSQQQQQQHATVTVQGSPTNDSNDSASKDDPISFRVRRSTIRIGRCKSFDERKLSSYEHLQKSLRNLIQGETEQQQVEHSESSNTSSSTSHDDPHHAGVDRRLQLARMKRNNHQSMRQLTTSGGSTRHLMMSLGGGSENDDSSSSSTPTRSAASFRKRSSLDVSSTHSSTSRSLIRQTRTVPKKVPKEMKEGRWHQPIITAPVAKAKDPLSSVSEHSTLNPSNNRRASMYRSKSSGSRRNLMATAVASSSDNSSDGNGGTRTSSTADFVTGSRIRRHGSVRHLIVEE